MQLSKLANNDTSQKATLDLLATQKSKIVAEYENRVSKLNEERL